jgi:flagellar protein FliO/FliZ
MIPVKKLFLIILLCIVCINVGAAELDSVPLSAIGLSDYFKVILGLAFVIALFLASTFLFKRYGSGPMANRGQMRLVDVLHLSNRERLVLVELKDKQILLSVTSGQINKLDTTDIPHSEERPNA